VTDALPNHSATHIYCGSRLWFLRQTQGIFCEVRTERHVDLLVFKVLMSLAPPRLS